MDALTAYSSSSSGGSDSDGDLSDRRDPSSKRRRLGGSSSPLPQAALAPAPAARSSLLPSAAALLDGSYSPPPAAQQRALEQAVLHQGRARAFPHVTGNFATHVYIKVPAPPGCRAALEELLQALRSCLPDVQPAVHAQAADASSPASASCDAALPAPEAASSAAAALCSTGRGGSTGVGGSTCGGTASLAQAEYHISLSRTVPLRLHQIEPLVVELRQRLRQQETFSIHLGRLEAFANDDRTRAFLSLAAEEGSPGGSAAAAGGSSAAATAGGGSAGAAGAESAAAAATAIPTSSGDGSSDSEEVQAQAQSPYSSQLVSLCHAVSQVFAAHGLPRFYADPRPHASVAWLLGDQRQQLEAALAAPDVAEAAARLAAQPWQLRPSAVVCKAGQREHMVWQAPGS